MPIQVFRPTTFFSTTWTSIFISTLSQSSPSCYVPLYHVPLRYIIILDISVQTCAQSATENICPFILSTQKYSLHFMYAKRSHSSFIHFFFSHGTLMSKLRYIFYCKTQFHAVNSTPFFANMQGLQEMD